MHKKHLLILAAVVSTTSVTFAQHHHHHASKLEKPAAPHRHHSVQPLSDEARRMLDDAGITLLETSQTGIELMGYVEASYMYSTRGGGTSADTGRGENPLTHEDSQDFNAYGAHLHIAKALPTENKWAAGFSLALQFGEGHGHGGHGHGGHGHGGHGHDDHGHGVMGEELSFLHEAFVEFRVPVGNGLDIKFGKWSSFFGYEPHDRPMNNHVTMGVIRHFLEPHSHTGLWFTYPLNELVTLDFGLSNGWDNDDSFFFDGSDVSKNLLFGVTVVNPERNARLQAAFSFSPDGEERFSKAKLIEVSDHHHSHGDEELAHEDGNVFAFNINGTWFPAALRDKLMLGFNATLVYTDDNLWRRGIIESHHMMHHRELLSDRAKNTATMWGAALYAKYNVTDFFSLAGRFEYLHADDSTLGLHDAWVKEFKRKDASVDRFNMLHTQTDVFSWTLTAQVIPVESLILRAEYRYDYLSARGSRGRNPHKSLLDVPANDQHTLGLYAAYLFW